MVGRIFSIPLFLLCAHILVRLQKVQYRKHSLFLCVTQPTFLVAHLTSAAAQAENPIFDVVCWFLIFILLHRLSTLQKYCLALNCCRLREKIDTAINHNTHHLGDCHQYYP